MKLSDILIVIQPFEYVEIVNLRYETIRWGTAKDLILEEDLLNNKVLSICSLDEDMSDYNGISILVNTNY